MQLTPRTKLAFVAGATALLLLLAVAAGYLWGSSQARSEPALLSEKATKAALRRIAELDPEAAAELTPKTEEARLSRDDYEQWLQDQLDAAHEELASHAAVAKQSRPADAATRDDVLRLVALGAEMARRADIEKLPTAERLKLSGRLVQAMTLTWKEVKGEDIALPADLYAAQ